MGLPPLGVARMTLTPSFSAREKISSFPAELELAFLRLEGSPGKNPERNRVHVGQLHESEVLVEDPGVAQPLVGVVVGSVKKMVYKRGNSSPAAGDILPRTQVK